MAGRRAFMGLIDVWNVGHGGSSFSVQPLSSPFSPMQLKAHLKLNFSFSKSKNKIKQN
jgi:hypothetical protein